MPADETKPQKQIQSFDVSARLIEIVPPVMRHIRKEMRSRILDGLTLPKFRTLTYLRRHPDCSLSDVANFLGLTPPTVSKMIQKLVEQGIIERRVAEDRRRVCLSLSKEGISALSKAREETRRQLAENLNSLSQEELAILISALEILEQVFTRNNISVNIPETI